MNPTITPEIGASTAPILPYRNAVVRAAKKRKNRNLPHAVCYRPRDIWELFGIPSSTLCELCNHPDPAKRIPSLRIPGRNGRKGIRLIERAAFETWLRQWRSAA